MLENIERRNKMNFKERQRLKNICSKCGKKEVILIWQSISTKLAYEVCRNCGEVDASDGYVDGGMCCHWQFNLDEASRAVNEVARQKQEATYTKVEEKSSTSYSKKKSGEVNNVNS